MHTIIAVLFLLFPTLSLAAKVAVDNHRAVYVVSGEFADVRDDLSNAILAKGMVISSVSRVGEMLERTGQDLGGASPIYGDAEVLEFCSAVISRRALEADPHSIVYCPYRIAIYSLPDAPEQIYLAYSRLNASIPGASQTALEAVEDMLRSIIEKVVE